MAASEELRRQVRSRLFVTFSDEANDARIDSVIIPNAQAAIRSKVGIPDDEEVDFARPGAENMLFLAHCYYQYNAVEGDFDASYAGEIAQARARWEVRQDADAEE